MASTDDSPPTIAPPSAELPARRRFWPRFSLRMLLVGMMVCCLAAAWFARHKAAADAQALAVSKWQAAGMFAGYDTQVTIPADVTVPQWNGDWATPPSPDMWHVTIEKWFGKDYCSDVVCLTGFESGSYLAPGDIEELGQRLAALPRLQAIDMFDSVFSTQVLEHCQNHRELRWLSLIRMGLADKDLEVISRLPQIERLNLDVNDITDAGALQLGRMKSLKQLSLGHTKVTASGIIQLRAALPNCEVLDDEAIRKKWPRP